MTTTNTTFRILVTGFDASTNEVGDMVEIYDIDKNFVGRRTANLDYDGDLTRDWGVLWASIDAARIDQHTIKHVVVVDRNRPVYGVPVHPKYAFLATRSCGWNDSASTKAYARFTIAPPFPSYQGERVAELPAKIQLLMVGDAVTVAIP